MKYNKSQIEHILNRFDQAAVAKLREISETCKVKEQRIKVTIPAQQMEVPVTLMLHDSFYKSTYCSNTDVRVDVDVSLYSIRDKMIETAKDITKKSVLYKNMLKDQQKMSRFSEFARENRAKLEDTLILGGSDALALLESFVTAINKFK